MESENELRARLGEINHELENGPAETTLSFNELMDKKHEIEGERLSIESELESTATNDKEEFKREWGPDLGWNTFELANEALDNLNATLKPEEKKWRFPTKDELLFAGKNKPSLFDVAAYFTDEEQGVNSEGNKTSRAVWVPSGEISEKEVFAKIMPTR
ncbi:MAG: hypothetical protein WCG97_03595 [bacterium]